MKILYIGNNLISKTGYYGTMTLLGEMISELGHHVVLRSDKRNYIYRYIDIFSYCLFKGKKFDLILIDVFSTKAFNYAITVAFLCKLFNISYINILRGGNLPERKIKSPKKLNFLLENAQLNITPSKYLLDSVANTYRTEVISNAIDLKLYPLKKKNYKGKIRLLFVRAIAEIYNPRMAVKVLKLIIDKGFEADLTFIGPDRDGSLENLESFIKEEHLNDFVRFTGVLKKKDWIELSKECNIFINTTNIDNTPVSVIEAMALGFPIVSTNVGGIPYLIDDRVHGILVGKNDYLGMANAIEEIYLNENLRENLIAQSQIRIREFSKDSVKQKWSNVLQGFY